jgi:hypothetical protein
MRRSASTASGGNPATAAAALGALAAEANDLAAEFNRQNSLLGLATPPSRGDLDSSFTYIQNEINISTWQAVNDERTDGGAALLSE